MTGEELVHIDDESEAAREEERFWKSMYFRWDRFFCTLGEIVFLSWVKFCWWCFLFYACSQLDAGERALVRGMRSQVEKMMERYPEGCEEVEEEEDEEEEEEEKDNEEEEVEEEDDD